MVLVDSFNPKLIQLYNKFKSKGVEVVGVSLDTRKESWERAVLKDNLPWLHVSDLKGWDSDISKLYGVEAIPATFVIDPKGIIVSPKIHGSKLEGKLNEIFR